MQLNEYQIEASKTAEYPGIGHNPNYPMVGLAGEAGEVLNKWKKVLRGDRSLHNQIDAIKQELGDVLWYLSQVATELELTLEDIAASNLAKLYDRRDSGAIKGDGDNR